MATYMFQVKRVACLHAAYCQILFTLTKTRTKRMDNQDANWSASMYVSKKDRDVHNLYEMDWMPARRRKKTAGMQTGQVYKGGCVLTDSSGASC